MIVFFFDPPALWTIDMFTLVQMESFGILEPQKSSLRSLFIFYLFYLFYFSHLPSFPSSYFFYFSLYISQGEHHTSGIIMASLHEVVEFCILPMTEFLRVLMGHN
jgi:hypothetical protein